jgi:hypothetical protein
MGAKEREDELADMLAAKTAECQRLRDAIERHRDRMLNGPIINADHGEAVQLDRDLWAALEAHT